MKNISQEKTKLSLIQTFRGAAAILVLIYHCAGLFEQKLGYKFLYGAFSQGYSGVDFFFVLSGFIIYYAHNKDIGNPNKLKTFLIKRFIRIYPVYWVVLLGVIPIYFIIPSFGVGYERNFAVILKSFLLIPQPHLPILGVAWTMSCEVLFYSIFSLIIALNPRISRLVITCWLIISAVFSITSNDVNAGFGENYLLNFMFSAYNFEFVVGCIIGYFILKFKTPKWGTTFMLAGVLMYILSCIINLNSLISIKRQILFGIPFAIIILGSAKKDIGGAKVPNLLKYLGDASYSIYLTHQPLISFLFKAGKSAGFYNTVGSFWAVVIISIIAILIGCLFHSMVEKPLLKFFRRKLLYKTPTK